MKELYYENYDTLLKEIKMTQIKGKIHHAHWLEELLLKWSYYPENIHIQSILIKIPNSVFHRTGTNTPKIYMEPPRPQISKSNSRRKNKTGGIMLPDFKLYYRAMVVETVSSWHKNTHISGTE